MKRTVLRVAGWGLVVVLAGCEPAPAPLPALPSPVPTATEPAEITELRARQLLLPSLGAGGECPVAGPVETTPAPPPDSPVARGGSHRYGDAPVFPLARYFTGDRLQISRPEGAPQGIEPGWYAGVAHWAAEPGFRGPVLIRAFRIDRPGRARVQLSMRSVRRTSDVFQVIEDWQFITGSTLVASPGCYAYQLDGPDFTETIVFRAEPQS